VNGRRSYHGLCSVKCHLDNMWLVTTDLAGGWPVDMENLMSNSPSPLCYLMKTLLMSNEKIN